MNIKSIYIYPIKSLAGISVESAELTSKGFKNDREYMLVDNDGIFISQRKFPQMSLFKTSFQDNSIAVEYSGNKIRLNNKKHSSKAINTKIWGQEVESIEVSNTVSRWFSDQLETNCKLVTYSSHSDRTKAFEKPPWTTTVSYADGFPYLIIGSRSFDDLNKKLAEPVGMNRFRPNLVIETTVPFQEDNWDEVIIGQAKMKIIKRCARCQMTTIDQETGESGIEPLLTLASYRKFDKKIYFGVNAIMLKGKAISVGDKVLT